MKVIVEKGHVLDDGKDIHRPGDEVDLSDKEAKRLLKRNLVKPATATESKTTTGGGGKEDDKTATGDPGLSPEVKAALLCHKNGDVTGSGAPKVEAMEKILGREMTAAERDTIWEQALNVLPKE